MPIRSAGLRRVSTNDDYSLDYSLDLILLDHVDSGDPRTPLNDTQIKEIDSNRGRTLSIGIPWATTRYAPFTVAPARGGRSGHLQSLHHTVTDTGRDLAEQLPL